MKAMLLAAGHGTRLRPATEVLAKCLLPVAGVPLLEIWARNCVRADIGEVLINLHAHADQVEQYLRARDSPPSVRISREPELLGSAGTLWANREWVEGEDAFWVFYADVLVNADLRPMLDLHRQTGAVATLAVQPVAQPERCGVVSLDAGNRIAAFVEKSPNPPSRLAFTGIMLCSSRIFELPPPHPPADLGYDILPALSAGGAMFAYRLPEPMLDIGTPANWERAQSMAPAVGARTEVG